MLSILLVLCSSGSVRDATCVLSGNGQMHVELGKVYGQNSVGWATFNDSINEIGWFKFHYTANSSASSSDQMYCAGLLDGYLSQEHIYNRFMLYKDIMGIKREEKFDEKWTQWLNENYEFTKSTKDPQVDLIIRQFNGLVDGYNAAAPEDKALDIMDLYIIQSVGDIYDLVSVWDQNAERNELWGLECSGLIRILPDYSDLYFAQDSWSSYQKLHNTLKDYQFDIKEFNTKHVVLSTKMGALGSSDDFWMNDQGLMILETTNNNFNKDLYNKVKVNTYLTWIRALKATYTAKSGHEWTKTFVDKNSGTYNNQYLVIDSKMLTPGKKPEKDLLWAVEQLPEMYVMADLTDVLVKKGYFPSINCPYFKEIFDAAGYPEKIKQAGEKGDYYDYYNSARYKIFDREAVKIKNMDDMKNLMRYNNYKDDEFGHHDPGQQILSRYDLRDENCKYGKAAAFGGLDTKVASLLHSFDSLSFDAIGCPKNDGGISPWEFGVAPFENVRYDGLPKVWNFSWTNFTSTNYSRCGGITDKESCINKDGCGWCTYSSECMLGYKSGPALERKCEDGWTVKTVLQPFAIPLIITVSVISVVFCCVVYGVHFWNKSKSQ